MFWWTYWSLQLSLNIYKYSSRQLLDKVPALLLKNLDCSSLNAFHTEWMDTKAVTNNTHPHKLLLSQHSLRSLLIILIGIRKNCLWLIQFDICSFPFQQLQDELCHFHIVFIPNFSSDTKNGLSPHLQINLFPFHFQKGPICGVS